MRLRGLKYADEPTDETTAKSKPLRLRGLKFYCVGVIKEGGKSKPLRLRGLKSFITRSTRDATPVEALAASWIEIYSVPARLALKSGRSPCGFVD